MKMLRTDSGWCCTDCDYVTNVPGNLKRHVESKHIDSNYSCDICGKQNKTKNALYMHKTRSHPLNENV